MIIKTSSSLRWNNWILQYMADVIVDGIPVGREWVDVPTVEEFTLNK